MAGFGQPVRFDLLENLSRSERVRLEVAISTVERSVHQDVQSVHFSTRNIGDSPPAGPVRRRGGGVPSLAVGGGRGGEDESLALHTAIQTHRAGDDGVFDVLSELSIGAITHLRRLLHGGSADEEDDEDSQAAQQAYQAHIEAPMRIHDDDAGSGPYAVDLQAFVQAVLRALSLAAQDEEREAEVGENHGLIRRESDLTKIPETPGGGRQMIDRIVGLFHRVDVACSGWITWEHVSEYILRPKTFQRTYVPKRSIITFMEQPVPIEMRGDNVEKLVYVKEINKLVACGVDGIAYVRNASTCAIEKSISDHTSMVLDATFAPRLNLLLTSGADRTIISYDAISLSKQKVARASCPQMCLEWSAGYQSVISGGSDGTVALWTFPEKVRPTLKKEIHAHNDMVMAVVPQLEHLYTASLDSTVKVWDLETATPILTQRAHSSGVHALAKVTEPSIMHISGGADRSLYLWSPLIPSPSAHLRGHDQAITGIVPIEGTTEIVSGDAGGSLRVWDLRMMECLQTLRPRGWMGYGFSEPFHSFAYNSQAREIFTVGRKWLSWKPMEQDVSMGVTQVAYNATVNHIVGLVGRDVVAWDGISGQLSARYNEFSNTHRDIMSMCFDYGEKLLVVGCSDGTVSTYVYPHGTEASTILVMPDTSEVTALYAVGDRLILAVSRYGRLGLYSLRDVTAPEELRSWRVTDPGQEIPVSAYGNACHLFACGGADRVLQIWAIETGLSQAVIKLKADVAACAFADDVDCLITVDVAGQLIIYSIPQFCVVARVSWNRPFGACAYHPIDHTLVTDDGPRSVISWNFGKILTEFIAKVEVQSKVAKALEEAETEAEAEAVGGTDGGDGREAGAGRDIDSGAAAVRSTRALTSALTATPGEHAAADANADAGAGAGAMPEPMSTPEPEPPRVSLADLPGDPSDIEAVEVDLTHLVSSPSSNGGLNLSATAPMSMAHSPSSATAERPGAGAGAGTGGDDAVPSSPAHSPGSSPQGTRRSKGYIINRWESCPDAVIESLKFVFPDPADTVLAAGCKDGHIHFWSPIGESRGMVGVAPGPGARHSFKSPVDSDVLRSARHARAEADLESAREAAAKKEREKNLHFLRSSPSPTRAQPGLSEHVIRRHGHPRRAVVLGGDLSLSQLSLREKGDSEGQGKGKGGGSGVVGVSGAVSPLGSPLASGGGSAVRRTKSKSRLGMVDLDGDGHAGHGTRTGAVSRSKKAKANANAKANTDAEGFHEWFIRQEFGDDDEAS